jgi:DNA polymerase-3 subunit epsilon
MISDRVFELLSDRVFVAHVNFDDYSFVRHELEERAGLKWTAKKLCTVRARKIRPGLLSYSLADFVFKY